MQQVYTFLCFPGNEMLSTYLYRPYLTRLFKVTNCNRVTYSNFASIYNYVLKYQQVLKCRQKVVIQVRICGFLKEIATFVPSSSKVINFVPDRLDCPKFSDKRRYIVKSYYSRNSSALKMEELFQTGKNSMAIKFLN